MSSTMRSTTGVGRRLISNDDDHTLLVLAVLGSNNRGISTREEGMRRRTTDKGWAQRGLTSGNDHNGEDGDRNLLA